jgi:hypothetical protein
MPKSVTEREPDQYDPDLDRQANPRQHLLDSPLDPALKCCWKPHMN